MTPRLWNVCRDCRCPVVYMIGPGWVHWSTHRRSYDCRDARPARFVHWRVLLP